MAKSNIFKNIPPKARFMLVTVILVTGAAIFAFFRLMGGSDQAIGDKVAGDISVKLNPTQQQISKSSPDEESIIPKGSPLDQQFEEARNKEIQDAKTSEKSFMDGLKIKNEDRVIEELDRQILSKSGNNVAGIDDILMERRAENQREALTLEERRRALLEKQRAESSAVNREQSRRAESRPIFDEEKWLDGHLSNADSLSFNDDVAVSAIVERTSVMSDYGQSRSRQEITSGNEKTGSNSRGGDSYIGPYLRKPNELPDMNLAQLDSDRMLAGQTRNTGNVEYQNAGGGSQPGVNTYEDSVYPTGMSPQAGGTYVPSGTIYYAVLEIGVNTDEVSPVRALVVQEGPMKGAVLLGSPERISEKVVISFNSMSLNGKDYSINAVALDPATMRTAIADDVDRHTFERYFKLATAAAISGYAEALTSTSTTKYSDGSEQQVQDRLPKTKDQVAVAVGRVGEQLIPIFEQEFGRVPTVHVYSNRDLGIMLMSGIDIK